MKKLSVSILSADFSRLADQIREAEEAGADWVHVDVMDGHFVPPITMGPVVLRGVRRMTALPIDVHLMITNPDDQLEAFAQAGADWIGVHAEAAPHLHRTLSRIRQLGARPTVVLNPATDLTALEYVLESVDMVLLMTVEPGFSGQKFIRTVLPKIKRLRKRIDEAGLQVLLQVDGGVHPDTLDDLLEAGADVFVAGSAVFGSGDIAAAVRKLKSRM